MRSKLGLDLPRNPVTICDNEIGALLKRTITILTAILALSTITIPAFADDKKIDICHYPPGNPDNPQVIEISKSAWDAHEEHGDFKIETDEDLTRCIGDTTTTTPVEPATTLPTRIVRVCIDEQIVEVEWEPDIEDKYEVVKTERDEKHCLPTPPTPTIPQPGLPHIVFPPSPPIAGYICTDMGVIGASGWLDGYIIYPTIEGATAACSTKPLPTVATEIDTPTSVTAAEVLPFTGIDPGLGALAGLAALSLGGILVRRFDG